MFEIYVLVPVKRSVGNRVGCSVMLLLALLAALLSCRTLFAWPFVFVFGVLAYCFLRSSKEFEYSYFDGEVRFARVMNKNRRKSLGAYSMEDVMQIAPAGERSVSKYERDNSVKVLDYSSHQKDVKYYEMVIQKDGVTKLIRFEPDDRYLEAVEQKYRSRVIR